MQPSTSGSLISWWSFTSLHTVWRASPDQTQHLDFAVQDFHLQAAINILREKGYNDTFYQNCTTFAEEREKRYDAHMKPDHWFHLYDRIPVHLPLPGHNLPTPPPSPAKTHVDLRLHRISECFWALPPIPLTDTWLPNDRNYIRTDDPRLPVKPRQNYPNFGAFPPQIPTVIIPSPARVIEAIIRLKARDRKRCCRGRCWDRRFAHFMFIGRKANDANIPPPISGRLYELEAFDREFHDWWTSEMDYQCIRSFDLRRELETVL